ncbi:MAG: SPOR domain-containing protein [Bacteroidetes bacterium]|nr:SPOR domain-containing protein [Bacteroidota bacterium]HET6244777.1 SPOR domain-containing protein [Bacteroidia bacterium]
MKIKLFLSFFCFLIAFQFCFAQEFDLTEEKSSLNSRKLIVSNNRDSLMIKTSPGRIHIIQDQRIDSLLKKHLEINESKQTLDGFRVQISTESGANSRKASNDAKAVFLSKYPNVDAYVVHHAPNFKVRVGDFRTKLDASKFLEQVKKDFRGAFIVKDEINLPKL